MKLAALVLTTFFSASALAAPSASKKIEDFVTAVSPLAESGVSEYQVEPGGTVKEILLKLALKEQYIGEKSEFSWEGTSSAAWEADSTNWGEENLAGAKSYIIELDEQTEDWLNSEGAEKELAKYKANAKAAKKAFETLEGTGVLWGVAPLGAVQCGVTFAGLAIIDPQSGKIWVFAREGSGC